MALKNTAYVEAVRQFETSLPKVEGHDNLDKKSDFFLKTCERFADRTPYKNERILDFGCGAGPLCYALRSRGYDASGADILAYWGEDRELYGADLPEIDADTRSHLFKINPENNHLPFEDETFEAVFSDQTFEHVFDYTPVFQEQFRVLKKGGIAVHRFPHGHTLIEPHTEVPWTPLTRYHAYLWVWAMLGRKNKRQHQMSRREVYESNKKLLKSTNYVPKKQILKLAEDAGFKGEFTDALDYNTNHAARILKAFRKYHVGFLVRGFLAYMQNSYTMILHKPA